jgi:hypothetical protein
MVAPASQALHRSDLRTVCSAGLYRYAHQLNQSVGEASETFLAVVALSVGLFLALVAPPNQSAHATDYPVIVAAGDIASTPGDMTAPCQDQETAALLAGADRVLPLGDNQYDDGALSDYLGRYDLRGVSTGRIRLLFGEPRVQDS